MALLFLQQVLKQVSNNASQTYNTVTPAEIALPLRMPPVFDIAIDLRAYEDRGSLELTLYQRRNHGAGYRLVYAPQARTGLSLIRINKGQHQVLDTSRRSINLADARQHSLRWSRDVGGQMTVSLDDTVLMELQDRKSKESIESFGMVNYGGAYSRVVPQ